MSVKNELDKFGKFIVQQSRSNLTKAGKKDRGTLYKSIGYEAKENKNSFELTISMADHGKFVDKGVRGATTSTKNSTSPYKFGTGTGKGGDGLRKSIDGWVQRKRIQFQQKDGKGVKGQFLSYKQTAFLISRSIWNKGLEATNFFERPFELAFKKLPDELIEAYGLTIDSLLKTSLK